MTRIILFFVSLLILSLQTQADEETPKLKIGSGQAIEALSKDGGIRLSKKAIETLDIKTTKIGPDFKVPSKSLIHERGEVGIYVLRDNFFKYVEIEVLSEQTNETKIESFKIRLGDQIVSQGASLLRLAEIDALNGAKADND